MTADDIRHRLAAAQTMDRADPRPGQETVIRNYVTDVGALLDQLDTLRNAGQALAEALGQTTALVHTPYLPRAEAIEAAALANWRAACGNTTRQEEG